MLKALFSTFVGLTLTLVLAIVNTFSRARETHGEEAQRKQH
jgi:hypothetical protein